MNDLSPRSLTPKKVLVGTVLLVLFVFLYSGFQNIFTRQSFGLSSGEAVAPTLTTAPSYGVAMGGRVMVNKMVSGEMAPAYDGYDMGVVSAPIPVTPSSAPAGNSKIVKTGDLSLLVSNVDDAAAKITAIRDSYNGQAGNANFSETGNGGKTGDITIWVPTDKFEAASADIKKLALRVENERVNVEDVSAQYTDLDARLKNLKAAEESYLAIMKQSGKISDVLAVTQQLNQTRGEIEETQGQMDYLSRQVALSSIHVSLTEEAVPSAVSHEWRPMTVLKAAFKNMLSQLTDSIDIFLTFVIQLPILLLNLCFWLAILWVLYRASRWAALRIIATSSKKE